jgi:hypothetical protein
MFETSIKYDWKLLDPHWRPRGQPDQPDRVPASVKPVHPVAYGEHHENGEAESARYKKKQGKGFNKSFLNLAQFLQTKFNPFIAVNNHDQMSPNV